MEPLNLRSVRAKAYKILKAGGISKATFERSKQVRGWGSWSGDVTIDEHFGNIVVAARARPAAETLARAVACLRAAGWTVADNGWITAVPA